MTLVAGLLSGCASAMQRAAERGDLNEVQALLGRGESAKKPDVLAAAVLSGNKELVALLLDHGADVNSGFGRGQQTSLMIAAYRKDLPMFQLLLDRGADTEAGKGSWWTPLEEAVKGGCLECARLMLERGANIDNADDDGRTALWEAADNGKEDAVRFLLERGADPGIKGRRIKGKEMRHSLATPLEVAQEQGFTGIVRLLQRHDPAAARAKAEADRAWAEVRGRVESAERRGDTEAKQGRAGGAMSSYLEAYRSAPAGHESRARLTAKLCEVARLVEPPPPVPKEALRHASRAEAHVKLAQRPSDFSQAAAEYAKAVELAPWWAEAHFNEGLAREKAGDLRGAIASLKRFLAAAPQAPEAAEVDQKVVELEVALEKKGGASAAE